MSMVFRRDTPPGLLKDMYGCPNCFNNARVFGISGSDFFSGDNMVSTYVVNFLKRKMSVTKSPAKHTLWHNFPQRLYHICEERI